LESFRAELCKVVGNTTSYVLNTYMGCRFDYSDVVYRQTAPLKQRTCKQVQLPPTNVVSATQPPDMFLAIQRRVRRAMRHLAKAISLKDIRFACKPVPVGSAHEGTKIGCCDEFDYNFVLTDLSKSCEVCYSPESPPGFVLLKASTPEYDKDLLNSNGILNTRIVKFTFETLVKQVLSSFSFCKNTEFEFIDPVQDFFVPPGTTAKLNTHIKLEFIKPVNGCHVPHNISIDVVPVLRIDNWWPYDMHRIDRCKTDDCQIVCTQPQLKYPWIGWTEPYGFISFTRAESRWLGTCPHVIKAAFMVVKRMSKYFCHYELFSSYSINTALFWCIDDDKEGFTKSHDSKDVNGDELLRWVQKI